MNNKKLTHTMLCNNVLGSFILVMHRYKPDDISEFISPFRVIVYHYVIIRDQDKFKFLDIMDSVDNTLDDFCFNNVSDSKDETYDFFFTHDDITKAKMEPEELSEKLIKIFNDKNYALLNTKHTMLKQSCMYKILFMRGESLPVYFAKVCVEDISNFKLTNDYDILNDLGATDSFLKQFQKDL